MLPSPDPTARPVMTRRTGLLAAISALLAAGFLKLVTPYF